MRVQTLQLENFKRFTDLTIEGLPASAKLVLLVGANGSGKSCVFDALNTLANEDSSASEEYLRKEPSRRWSVHVRLETGEFVARESDKGLASTAHGAKFFGRPSLRVVPVVKPVSDAVDVIARDRDRSSYFTHQDRRFDADVARFAGDIDQALRAPTFAGRSADTAAIFREHIEPLNSALQRVFGISPEVVIQIKNYESADVRRPVRLIFSKGRSTIPFDYLSHGEKQVVILLLGFAVRRAQLEDAIVFIDEMDLHLNTKLQRQLLAEITENWIPDSSQLWTASHALGFIEYARESDSAVLIDFDALDFDETQVLTPCPKERLDVIEIAVPRDSLAKIFAGRTIVVCEGKDHLLYNAAFADQSQLLFVPPGGSDNAHAVLAMARRERGFLALRDRDFLLDEEVAEIQRELPNLRVLPYYSIENLLYHPDNVASLELPEFDADAWRREIVEYSKAHPLRDVKHERGRIAELRTVRALDRAKASERDPQEIYDAQDSNDFERAYRVLPMKRMPKSHLDRWQLTPERLAQSTWFRDKVRELLQR